MSGIILSRNYLGCKIEDELFLYRNLEKPLIRLNEIPKNKNIEFYQEELRDYKYLNLLRNNLNKLQYEACVEIELQDAIKELNNKKYQTLGIIQIVDEYYIELFKNDEKYIKQDQIDPLLKIKEQFPNSIIFGIYNLPFSIEIAKQNNIPAFNSNENPNSLVNKINELIKNYELIN